MYDPLLDEPGRRLLLVKVVEGDGTNLNNAILEFRWEETHETHKGDITDIQREQRAANQ